MPHDEQEHLRAAGVRDFRTMMPSREALQENIQSAARTQVRYLHSRGHRTIAYCGSDSEPLTRFDEMRRADFLDEGAILSVGLVDLGSHHRAEDVAQAFTARADSDSPVTAVAAYNDEIAFLVPSAARSLGFSVPAELAVIGTDDIPLATEAFPPLTTVTLGDPDLVTAQQLNTDIGELGPRVVVRESA